MAVVTVHPQFEFPYYTYILHALKSAGTSIRFRGLDDVPQEGRHVHHRMALLHKGRRIAILTNDFATPDEALLRWANVYFATNISRQTLQKHPDIQPLGPIFSTSLWGPLQGAIRAMHGTVFGMSARRSLGLVRFQSRVRLPISSYRHVPSEGRYVFFAARRWAPKHPEADEPRKRFLSAIATLDVEFEGGFLQDRLPIADYIRKVQRSAIAFNSPAVHTCLGWKLGEFLALGKAILSTPIDRILPAPLQHGEHIHYVTDDTASIRGAVELLLEDIEYRRQLERGAQRWYRENLAPKPLGERILLG